MDVYETQYDVVLDVTESDFQYMDKSLWLGDSRASSHMTNDLEGMTGLKGINS